MIRYLPVLIVLALTVYALVDCVRTEDDRVRGLPKVIWVLIILLFNLVGSLAWLIAGRERVLPRTRPSAGPIAPDDDPDFLREIERRRREQDGRDAG